MNKIAFYLLQTFTLIVVLNSCTAPPQKDNVSVTSPNDKFRFDLQIINSEPIYSAYFNNNKIIGKSSMGFNFSGNETTSHNLTIKSVKNRKVDKLWNPIYGEKNQYPEQYHEVIVDFNTTNENIPVFKLNIRAYNQGIAFRYEFENNGEIIIKEELTEFALPADSEVWVSHNAQANIAKRKVSELEDKLVERPLLAQLNDSLFVALGEAALIDFARMKFAPNKEKPGTLVASLDGEVTYDKGFKSPWRTIMAGNTAGELLENNYLILNLNEPSKITNPEWIKPGKVIREVTLTTEGGLTCVDFAVKHNLQYIEFDAGWYGHEYDETSDATTVTVDPKRSKGPLDLPAVIKYAESKGVGVILYVNRAALEKQLDEVLPLLKSWGVKGVKYGFVNVGSQKWTNWLHEAVRKAADYGLMVDIHDEYRPTGYSRTYPNLMTQEGIRGDEASVDNTMVLKTLFVRMLAGAGDHTYCYFNERVDAKLGSHASQLAKAVCLYSPWQFLYWYDKPVKEDQKTGTSGDFGNSITEVPELTFFDQLPTVWDDTKVIQGYPGEYAVVARKSGTTWFVGALNGEQERDYAIPFNFLDPNSQYEATVFTDDKEIKTRTKVAIDSRTLTSKDIIKKTLERHQGMALIIKKVE
ncbi:glycoside hydrolase family 97 protein [Arcticibacterium luteifluviistationis]|uniref:Alpha-glucosidase n=1 Tax=Arcticibacterium luteifluviistationis TaxID=1784714 RepID=A0A2Z4G7B5_9BACT|nr:glycoside hydrolase family 97 protein [Arcticibacterium luteifluviistationis]AWV97072.1 alpha-glucosidase [Arcticibacterium luteifluviistationis]